MDADFTNVTFVETLLLSGTGAQNVTLATLSDAAGIRTVTATAGNASTINISGTTTNVVVSTNAGADTITAGSGNDNISTGTGDDLIKFLSANFDLNDTVAGGTQTATDTIQVTDNATVVDADFTSVTSVETLLLSGTGAQSVTLSTLSDAAGIRTVTATAGNASTINISGTTTNVAVSTDVGNDTITAGSGADNISTGANDDLIKFLSANFDLNDTVAGSTGSDTIQVTDNATVIDSNFTHVTLVETLLLSGTGAQSVTFDGTTAQTAGIHTITATASTLGSTIDISGTNAGLVVSSGSGADTITAGAGNDNINTGNGVNFVKFISDNFDLNDTVAGGAGVDTIQVIGNVATGNAAVVDADFTHVSSVEVLQFMSGTNTITLGNWAYTHGITTVIGGSGDDTITTSGVDAERGAVTINLASGGTDTLYIQNDTIGNNGSNTSAGGLGGAIVGNLSNATTINGTIALWTAAGSNTGTSAVTINGFTAGNGGDQIRYLLGDTPTMIGGYADNVSLVTNDLAGLAVNSVIEIASTFQISNPSNLGAVATMLDRLNNVQNGTYYVIIYDGTSANSNAYLYVATATEGNGFSFADANGATNGYNTDTVELLAKIMGVGGDTMTSLNFI